MAKKKRVVVTGATGFVGRHVVERLLHEELEVVCMVRKHSDCSVLAPFADRITIVNGDITQKATLLENLQGAWGVINIAGLREFWSADRKEYFRLNEAGARNVFTAALECKVKKVVQVSTPLAFGVPETLPFNETSATGEHPSDYARSKYLGDCAGWELHREQKLPLTVVHLAAVIGAGDDKETMEVRRAVEKKMPALIGADTTYTYVYVRDAADAIVKALLLKTSVGRRYLIGTERATTREYFGIIGDIANVPVPSMNIPEAMLMPFAEGLERLAKFTRRRPLLPMDVLKTTAAGSLLFDGSRAIDELGMSYTPLKTALAEAVADLS